MGFLGGPTSSLSHLSLSHLSKGLLSRLSFSVASAISLTLPEMEGPGSLLHQETSVPKSRKKKVSAQKAPMPPQQDDSTRGFQDTAPPRPPPKSSKKSSQRGLKNGVSPPLQPPEFSPADSLPDLSSSGNEYRALRRKYLMLEEESGGLGNELREVEDEVRTLEEEKLALLDELVVLEGLIDRSELQSQNGQR